MKLKKKPQFLRFIILCFVLGGLTFFVACIPQKEISESNTSTQILVVQSASYKEIPLEQMYKDADWIYVGKITNISSTRWNQDNGEYWNDEAATGETALQIHTIEVEIIQFLVDDIGQEETVQITVLGLSPSDRTQADHDLKIGDQVILFTQKREIAWRDGTKTVIGLMGAPSYSYFILGEDGLYSGALLAEPTSLQEVISQISDQRDALP